MSGIKGHPLGIQNPLMGAVFEECCNDLNIEFELRLDIKDKPKGWVVVDVFINDVNHFLLIGQRSYDYKNVDVNPDLLNKWTVIFRNNYYL